MRNLDEIREQEINKIKEYPITEYASILGFTLVKKGRWYSLQEHDSVRINPEKNIFYRNSTGARGSIIDFSMEFEDKDYVTAIKELKRFVNVLDFEPNYAHKILTPKKEKMEFVLPKREKDIKNVFAYLVNTRKIDKDIVSELIQRRQLYQDSHKNCVFVSYDSSGKADFASLRGTDTYKRFVADVPGCNYDNCFYIDNKADTVVVTESVIDALSVMSRHKKGHEKCNYLALSGTQKYPALLNRLKHNPNIKKVVLALDNDMAGKEAVNDIREALTEINYEGEVKEFIPEEKDWNAQLQRERADLKRDMPTVQKNFKKGTELEL